VLVSWLLILIAAFDIRTHRIPNSALLLLSIFSIFEEGFNLNPRIFALTSCLVFLFTWISGCGYGDAKLLMILLNLVIPSGRLFDYSLALLLTSAFLVLLHLIRNRSMSGEIAFAPALCGAVLLLAPLGNF
jgi:Flp pilus assembly protein protease CpaA